MEKERPLRQRCKNATLCFSWPLKNCESEQQIEAISVIAQEVTATKLTKGLLILA